jgi:hypothetical protein
VGHEEISSGSDEEPHISEPPTSPIHKMRVIDLPYRPSGLAPLSKKSYFSSRAQSTPFHGAAVEATTSTSVQSTSSSPSHFPKPIMKKKLSSSRARTWGFTQQQLSPPKKGVSKDIEL